MGTHDDVNASGDTYVAYCFAEIEGFSAFGSYEGNANADGPLIFLGMSPAYVLTKNADALGSWVIHDNKRNPFNPANLVFNANRTYAEATEQAIDYLSTGFKIRASTSDINEDAKTFIYMAFASNPFGGASTTPATAF